MYPASFDAPPPPPDVPPAAADTAGRGSRLTRVLALVENVRRREDRLALVLSLLIGALVGLVVVAFILLTGRGDRELVVKAAQAGVNNYLIKPFTTDLLRHKLERFAAR